jgi:hypothetical protein
MDFEPARLRHGEVIAGVAAVVLALVIFILPWYGLAGEVGRTASSLGVATTVNGWDGLPTLRWLMLATLLAALALTFFQGSRRAPALPVTLSIIVPALGLLTVLCLIYRVLLAVPGPDSLIEARLGAYLGLVAAIVLTYGGYRSLREEQRPDPEQLAAIPTVELEPGARRGAARS